MEYRSIPTFCSLLLIGTVTGQSAPPHSSERLLPQWLTGIIAVSSFLLLVFIGFVVKKMWCQKSSGTKPTEESTRGAESGDGNEYDTTILQGMKSNEPKGDHVYTTCEDVYETSIEVLRSNNRKPRKENIYESCDDIYETSLDGLRKNSRSKRENFSETCENEYETSVEALRNQSRSNVYDNKAMDHTDNKSTSM